MLAMYVDANSSDWDLHIKPVLYAYKSAVNESTKETPFYLTYGRDPILPIDRILNVTSAEEFTPDSYTTELTRRIYDGRKLVADNMESAQQKQKRNYDKKVNDREFAPGDQVLWYDPTNKPGELVKFKHRWTGPYRILRRVGLVDYEIRLSADLTADMKIRHANQLKKYVPRIATDANFESKVSRQVQPKNKPVQVDRCFVWAKLKGYPYWPAEMVSVEALPPSLKKPKNGDWIPVHFLGENKFGYVKAKDICPFKENRPHYEKNPRVQKALRELDALLKIDTVSTSLEHVNSIEDKQSKNHLLTPILCQGLRLMAKIDTGSAKTVIKSSVFQKLHNITDVMEIEYQRQLVRTKYPLVVDDDRVHFSGDILIGLDCLSQMNETRLTYKKSMPTTNSKLTKQGLSALISLLILAACCSIIQCVDTEKFKFNDKYGVIFEKQAFLDNAHDHLLHHFSIPIEDTEIKFPVFEMCADPDQNPVCNLINFLVKELEDVEGLYLLQSVNRQDQLTLLAAHQTRTERGILSEIACFIEGIFGGCNRNGADAESIRDAVTSLNDRVQGLSSEVVNVNGRMVSLTKLTKQSFEAAGYKINILKKGLETLDDRLSRFVEIEEKHERFDMETYKAILYQGSYLNLLMMLHDQEEQHSKFLRALHEIESGYLPIDLVKPIELKTILENIKLELNGHDTELTYSVRELNQYYSLLLVTAILKSRDDLLVRIQIPIIHKDMMFTVYKIHFSQIEVEDDILMEILPTFSYIGINADESQYLLLTNEEYSSCIGGRYKRCQRLLPHIPKDIKTCESALFFNALEDIPALCTMVLIKHKRAQQQAFEIDSGQWYLAAVSNQWRLVCDESAPRIPQPCKHCIVNVPCGCGISMPDLTIPKRYQGCANTSAFIFEKLENPFKPATLYRSFMPKDHAFNYSTQKRLSDLNVNISKYLDEHLASLDTTKINFTKFIHRVLLQNHEFVQADVQANDYVKHQIAQITNEPTNNYVYLILLAVGECLLFFFVALQVKWNTYTYANSQAQHKAQVNEIELVPVKSTPRPDTELVPFRTQPKAV